MHRLPRILALLALTCATPLVTAGCGDAAAVGEDIPSPDELGPGDGKTDGDPWVLKGNIGLGETVSARLYSTKTFHGYAFEALEGAQLKATGTSGRAIAVYGPEDVNGKFGLLSIASTAAGTNKAFTLPEDGRYVVLIGKKLGNYTLTLGCDDGCDVDPNAGKTLVNAATETELSAAGLDADEIADYRATFGLATALDDLGLGSRDDLSPALHRVFFSPKVGAGFGWSPESQGRDTFVRGVSDAEVTWVDADVAQPIVDLFRRAETGIDVAMYGLSLSTPEGKELLAAAARGVPVRVYLDVSERDPEGNPYTGTVIKTLLATPNVSVKVPKYSSKMMHQKFGVVDGVHVFVGSANVSTKASNVYTEDRFVFMSSPDTAAQLVEEFDRLWTTLGKDAALIVSN